MRGLSVDHTDCVALIYDTEGNHLGNTLVTRHDRTALRIEVQKLPPALNIGDGCQVLVQTSPSPCEYHGRVKKEGAGFFIALFQGHERECRESERYNIRTTATIENLICNGHAYPLHTPLEVTVVNISRSGVRFSVVKNTFSVGDTFQMRMRFSDGDKILIADVVNHFDCDEETTEYGCRFLVAVKR